MSGYMLRRDMAQQAAGERRCPNPACTEPMYRHHELPRVTYGLASDRLSIEEVPNPAYRPLHFHCDSGTCQCVQIASGARNVPLTFTTKTAELAGILSIDERG